MNEFCKEAQEDEDREDVLAERKVSGPGEGSVVLTVGPDNLSLSSFLGTHSRRTEPTARVVYGPPLMHRGMHVLHK